MNSDKSFVDLPDHIYVSRLKDIFWNNNSDLYPSNIPEISLYDKLEQTRPTFHTPYSGICIIEGDYNHALYNGKYYFLKKLDPIDLTNNTYKYQLDEDVVINLLNSGCSIKGTLIRTNKQKILKETLQTCVPILNNPTQQTILSFNKDASFDWRKEVKINTYRLSTYLLKIRPKAFTKNTYDNFKRLVNRYGKYVCVRPWQNNSNGVNNYKTSEPLFLISTFAPTPVISHHYHVILNLFKFLDDFKDPKKREKFTLRKLTIEGSDYLSGKYCITYNDDTGLAGTEESSVIVTDLDFSDVKGVEALNLSSPTPYNLEDNTKLQQSDIFSIWQNRIFKLCRNPHLPLYNSKTSENKRKHICDTLNLSAVKGSFDVLDYCRETTYSGNQPQLIELNEPSNNKGIWYYVNRLDFAIVRGFRDWYRTGWDSVSDEVLIKNFLDYSYPDRAWDYIYDYEFERENETAKTIPPLGIKFIGFANRADFDDFEYIKEAEINSISYYNGINTRLKNYINENYKLPHFYLLSNVTGNEFLSKLLLALDGVRFTLILPSDNSLRKQFSADYYGYMSVFGDNRQQDSYRYYPAKFLNWDFTIKGKWYQPLRMLEYRRNIEGRLTKGSIILEKPVNKGDILFIEDDWSFKTSAHILYQIPLTLSQTERLNIDILGIGGTTFSLSQINLGYVDESIKPHLDYYVEKLNSTPDTEENKEIRELYNQRITDIRWLWQRLKRWNTYDWEKQIVVKNEPTFRSGLSSYQHSGSTKTKESLVKTMITMGDFFGAEDVIMPNFGVVVYAHKSKLHLGYLSSREYDFELSQDDNYIRSIDGRTKWEKTVTHIKHISTLDTKQEDMFEGKEADVFSNIPPEYNLHITHRDLLDKTKTYVFDIKGTIWYCVFSKGKIHLVSKDNTASCFKTDKNLQLYSTEPKKDEKSIFSKINEKAALVIYGKTRALNTKFDLNKPINLWVRPVVLPTVESLSEYYQIKFETDADCINDWVQTFKEIKQGIKLNTTEYEALKLQVEKNDLEFLQYQQLNELAINRQKTKAYRENEDLDDRYKDESANIGLGTVSAAVGLGMSFLRGRYLGSVHSVIHGAQRLQSGITFLTRDYSKLKGRVSEDERMFMQENSISLMHRKQNYEHNLKRSKIQLNSIVNTYLKPTINDAIIQKKYNELNNLSDFQLHIFSPNEAQLTKIDNIYSTFGCECVSNKYIDEPLRIENNMEEGLYQFSELQPNALDCEITEDLYINELVRGIFEMGVKFNNTTHQSTQERFRAKHESQKLVFDTTKIPEWTSQVWSAYAYQTNKKKIIDAIRKFDKFGLTDDEYTTNKDNIDFIKDNDDKLLKAVNEILSQRREGVIGIADIDPELQRQRREQEIQRQLDECLKQKEEFEQAKKELEQCKEELKNKKDEHTTAIEDLNTQLQTIRKTLIDKENEIERIKTEKERCDQQLSQQQHETAKIPGLEEQIRNCNTELNKNKSEKQKLQQEIGVVKQQIAEKTREKEAVDAQLRGVQTSLDQKNTELEQCKKDLEDQKRSARLEKENLNNQKQDLERQLRECLQQPKQDPAQIRQLTQQLDAEKRKTADCQRQITNLTNRLKAAQAVGGEVLPNECELLHGMIDHKFNITNRSRGNTTLVELLCRKIAEQMEEMYHNNVKEEIEKYPLVDFAFQVIEELEDVKAISVYRDAINADGWEDYVKFKDEGGNKTSKVTEIEGMLSVVNFDSLALIHSLKTLLDEMAYRIWSAKQEHSIKDKQDPDNAHRMVSDIDLDENLQYLFGFFVNEWRPIYRELIGVDVDIAIKRKEFEGKTCRRLKSSGQRALTVLDNIHKTIGYINTDVPSQPLPPGSHYVLINLSQTSNLKEIKDLDGGEWSNYIRPSIYLDSRTLKPLPKDDNYDRLDGANPYFFRVDPNTISKNYERWWSKKQGSGSKYYSYVEGKIHQIGFQGIKAELHTAREEYTPYAGGIYIHWAGQLDPTTFANRRYTEWEKGINAFHRAISHEDMRDEIKRSINRKKIQIRVYHLQFDPFRAINKVGKLECKDYKQWVRFFERFGKRDAYKAFWIAVVLSWNGVYMNKVYQGTNAYKYRIQPHYHPFHNIDTQEIIQRMADIFKGTKPLEVPLDFGGFENFILIIHAILRKHLEVLKFTQLVDFLKAINSVGYYTWNEKDDADWT